MPRLLSLFCLLNQPYFFFCQVVTRYAESTRHLCLNVTTILHLCYWFLLWEWIISSIIWLRHEVEIVSSDRVSRLHTRHLKRLHIAQVKLLILLLLAIACKLAQIRGLKLLLLGGLFNLLDAAKISKGRKVIVWLNWWSFSRRGKVSRDFLGTTLLNYWLDIFRLNYGGGVVCRRFGGFNLG